MTEPNTRPRSGSGKLLGTVTMKSNPDSSISITAPIPSNKSGSIIPTPNGDVRVRPYRSTSTSQLKAMITFTPRASGLDRHNVKAATDPFWGFYTLFWIGLFLILCRAVVHSWETSRTLLSFTFGRLITRDGWVLAISDFIMVASMFICVPFVKGLKNGTYRYYWTGAVIQHLWQTAFLGVVIWWGWYRQWYWVQAGFLVLHALSSMMKMHSYCAHNGMLSDIYFSKKAEEARLEQLLDSFPDHGKQIRTEAEQKAKAEAELNHQEAEDIRISATPATGAQTPSSTSTNGDPSPTSSRRGSDIPVGTPMVPPGATSFTTGYVSQGDLLKLRLAPEVVAELNGSSGPRARLAAAASHKPSSGQLTPTPLGTPAIEGSGTNTPSSLPLPTGNNADPLKSPVQLGTSLEPAHMGSSRPKRPASALTYASDERIATLARNIDTMRDELTSHGSEGVVWPDNIGYKKYWEFMCMPTLCYQLWYPRTTT
ncbi:hypothetical protein QFC22_003097 [Naganishia vaughanmartiniae]|uniref:Uncharacterized protein n=1 Tax=Naganishia vaughanmartiniae TaxID=1424756 RepID=A0ACC2XBT2_9TREE|nr:hypothetical protein QFC22_003097 [Naganishia vaughanmartiniae]